MGSRVQLIGQYKGCLIQCIVINFSEVKVGRMLFNGVYRESQTAGL